MKAVLLIGLGAMLLAAGCGDASSDDPADGSVLSEAETTVTLAVPSETDAAGSTTATTPSPVPGEEVDPIDRSLLDPVTTKPPESAPPEGEPVSPPAVEHPNPQVATAIADLVERLGVAPDAIEVVSVDEVTWPDGSIGCPLPGMRYTQALVNGSRIVLRVDGVDYQYNSGGGREPFYCQNPSDPVASDYGDV